MPAPLDAKRRGALALVVALALALLIALAPYATGLIAIPVLYVALAPVHAWLARLRGPNVAASVVVGLALLVLVVLGGTFAGLIVTEAGRIAGNVTHSPLLARLSELSPGGVDLGARLADLGATLVSWIGSSALGLIGSASRFALNLTISLFGLYYLLLRPRETWDAVRPYIPFSAPNTEKLRQHFRDVTTSTLLGTGLSAAVHGVLMTLAFWMAGLPNAALWGVVTMVFSILPVLGSGMVWGPAAIVLLLDHRPGAAVLLALWGLVVVGNVDYVIRPMVSRRWAHIHPLVTLMGALVGVPYFGILGLLIGPLAISYFFELIDMYRAEYLSAA
jgi:predicted PurR-regulated permease PerM